VRVDWNPDFDEQLAEAIGTGDLEQRAQAIADACNADSTWGGYHAAAGSDGKSAQVWSADARNDEARDQRLIRFLDHGRMRR